MCGICGIVRFDGNPVESAALSRGCDSMRHRGPDHSGVWIDADSGNSVGLGATRLIVLDPSPSGHQPMHDRTGRYHLVFNGEIYNFRELRRSIGELGREFLTEGDTEVVLASCARWGVDALQRFNGMWALAFYDSHTRTGFLARDRFGIKPLLYGVCAGALCFASEIRAQSRLCEACGQVNPSALIQHLQFGYIAHPATIYSDVMRLPPGHALVFSDRGASGPSRYYRLLKPPDPSEFKRYDQAAIRVRNTVEHAVTRRRVSDVPIGAFLSGGLDSTIVVAHLAAASGDPVKTFAVGYDGHRAYDESSYARLVASRFGTEHHEVLLTSRDIVEAVPRILDHLDEPVGDSSIVPTALVSEFARRYVTVVLSGDGADELMGGYWRYLGHDALRMYSRIPSPIRRGLLEPLLGLMSVSKSSRFADRVRQMHKLLRSGDFDPLTRHVAWSRILAPQAEKLFRDRRTVHACEQHTLERARLLTEHVSAGDTLNRILAFDLQHQLPCDMLHKVDQASMMHSLEVRVPFLDHDVVESALALPSEFKIHRGLRKRILIDAYRGHVPDEILDRPKQGFEVPMGELLRGPLRSMFHDTVTRKSVESFGLLSYSAVQKIYQDHLARRVDHADLLFALLSLCWWKSRPSR